MKHSKGSFDKKTPPRKNEVIKMEKKLLDGINYKKYNKAGKIMAIDKAPNVLDIKNVKEVYE